MAYEALLNPGPAYPMSPFVAARYFKRGRPYAGVTFHCTTPGCVLQYTGGALDPIGAPYKVSPYFRVPPKGIHSKHSSFCEMKDKINSHRAVLYKVLGTHFERDECDVIPEILFLPTPPRTGVVVVGGPGTGSGSGGKAGSSTGGISTPGSRKKHPMSQRTIAGMVAVWRRIWKHDSDHKIPKATTTATMAKMPLKLPSRIEPYDYDSGFRSAAYYWNTALIYRGKQYKISISSNVATLTATGTTPEQVKSGKHTGYDIELIARFDAAGRTSGVWNDLVDFEAAGVAIDWWAYGEFVEDHFNRKVTIEINHPALLEVAEWKARPALASVSAVP